MTGRRMALVVMGVLACVGALLWLRRHLVVRLRLADDVSVRLPFAVPFETHIEEQVDVLVDEQIEARVKLGSVSIDLDERVDVPLHFNLDVPVDFDVRIDQPVDLSLEVPVDTVLTEKELDLSRLAVPIDQDVFIDDAIDVNVVVPIDTTVSTTLGVRVPVKAQVPVRARIPVKQRLHVKDTLRLALDHLRVPLHLRLPVHAQVPLHQTFRVRGTVSAPIHETVRIPIRKTIHPAVTSTSPITVGLTGTLPARVKGRFTSAVAIERAIPVRVGTVQVGATAVSIGLEGSAKTPAPP